MSQIHRIKGETTDEAFQCFMWERGASVDANFGLFTLKAPGGLKVRCYGSVMSN